MHPLFAQSRMMLPVFGGICGFTRTILNICCFTTCKVKSDEGPINQSIFLFAVTSSAMVVASSEYCYS